MALLDQPGNEYRVCRNGVSTQSLDDGRDGPLVVATLLEKGEGVRFGLEKGGQDLASPTRQPQLVL